MTVDYVIKNFHIVFTAARTCDENPVQATRGLKLRLMRTSVTYRQFIGLCFSKTRFMRTETCLHRPRVMTSNHLGPSHLDRVCLRSSSR